MTVPLVRRPCTSTLQVLRWYTFYTMWCCTCAVHAAQTDLVVWRSYCTATVLVRMLSCYRSGTVLALRRFMESFLTSPSNPSCSGQPNNSLTKPLVKARQRGAKSEEVAPEIVARVGLARLELGWNFVPLSFFPSGRNRLLDRRSLWASLPSGSCRLAFPPWPSLALLLRRARIIRSPMDPADPEPCPTKHRHCHRPNPKSVRPHPAKSRGESGAA